MEVRYAFHGLAVTMATALKQFKQLYREQKEEQAYKLFNIIIVYSISKRNPLKFACSR
jgi:hypothetical protein